MTVIYGGTYGNVLAGLTRFGYNFTNWTDGNGTVYTTSSKIEAKNLNLKANWEAKTMKVTYNYNLESIAGYKSE